MKGAWSLHLLYDLDSKRSKLLENVNFFLIALHFIKFTNVFSYFFSQKKHFLNVPHWITSAVVYGGKKSMCSDFALVQAAFLVR